MRVERIRLTQTGWEAYISGNDVPEEGWAPLPWTKEATYQTVLADLKARGLVPNLA